MLDQLVIEYEKERDNEGDRFLRKVEPPYISAFNPRFYNTVSQNRRYELWQHMKIWTREWWYKKGYYVDFSDKGDGFNVSLIEE